MMFITKKINNTNTNNIWDKLNIHYLNKLNWGTTTTWIYNPRRGLAATRSIITIKSINKTKSAIQSV